MIFHTFSASNFEDQRFHWDLHDFMSHTGCVALTGVTAGGSGKLIEDLLRGK